MTDEKGLDWKVVLSVLGPDGRPLHWGLRSSGDTCVLPRVPSPTRIRVQRPAATGENAERRQASCDRCVEGTTRPLIVSWDRISPGRNAAFTRSHYPCVLRAYLTIR